MNIRYIIAIALMALPKSVLSMEGNEIVKNSIVRIDSVPSDSVSVMCGPEEAFDLSASFSGAPVPVQRWPRIKRQPAQSNQLFSRLGNSLRMAASLDVQALVAGLQARAASFFTKSQKLNPNAINEKIDIREVHATVRTLNEELAAWQKLVKQLAPHLEITPENKLALTKLVLNGALILEVVELDVLEHKKRIHTEVMDEDVKTVVSGMSVLKRSLENQEKSFALFQTKNAHGSMPQEAYDYSINALLLALKGLFRDPESYKNSLTVIIETLHESVEDAQSLMKTE